MGFGVSRCSPRRHHAGTINRGNLNFSNFSLVIPTFSHVGSYLSYYLVHSKTISFLISSGSKFIRVGFVSGQKAAQLRHEGLGKIKIALAGTDTSSLLENLEGHFGRVDLDTSKSTVSTEKSEKEVTIEEKPSGEPERNPSHSFWYWWLSYCRAGISFEVHSIHYHWPSQTLFTTSWPQDPLSIPLSVSILLFRIFSKSCCLQSHSSWSP